MVENLEKLAIRYPNILFTRADGFGVQIQRKQNMGIKWTTLPAFAYNNYDESDMMPFPHEFPFTMKNLIAYIDHFIKSGYRPKGYPNLPDKPHRPKRGWRVEASVDDSYYKKKEDL